MDDKNTFNPPHRGEPDPDGGNESQPSQTPKDSAISQGSWIASRYQVFEPIGEGAFSTVYRAWDGLLRREIALKLYEADISLNVARDESEWQARIQHPNLMPILDAGADPALGRYFVAMPLYPGETLENLLNSPSPNVGGQSPMAGARGTLAVKTALVYCDQVLSALDFIERRRGGIHGDIKPSNIWVTRNGSAVLMDYGVAVIAREGDRIGTPGYGAPETLSGTADIRSDIFSVGCVLYRMLTGVEAFSDDYEVLNKHVAHPSVLRGDLRPYLDILILKAMDRDPEKRFQSAREMQNALRHPPLLERIRSHNGASAHHYSSFSPTRTFVSLALLFARTIILHPRRAATMLFLIAVLVLLMVSIIAGAILLTVHGLAILHRRYPWGFALLGLTVLVIAAWYLSGRVLRMRGDGTRFWSIFVSLISPGLGSLKGGSFQAGIAFLSMHSLFMLTWWLPSAHWEKDYLWIFVIAIAVWVASVIHVIRLRPDLSKDSESVNPLSLLLGVALGAAAVAPLRIPYVSADSSHLWGVGGFLAPTKISLLSGLPVVGAVIAGAPAGVLASILSSLLSVGSPFHSPALGGNGVTGSFLLWQMAATCAACGWAFALSKARKSLSVLGVLFVNMENVSLWSGESFGWLSALTKVWFWEQTLAQTAVTLLTIELACGDSWLRERIVRMRGIPLRRRKETPSSPSERRETLENGKSGTEKSTYRFR